MNINFTIFRYGNYLHQKSDSAQENKKNLVLKQDNVVSALI